MADRRTRQHIEIQCSFCLKRAPEVAKIIAGPGTYICNECVGLCNDILTAASDADTAGESTSDGEPHLPAWHAMSDDEVLARLPKVAASAAQVEVALRQWIGEARRRGASWAQVGAVLEMSRQSAWERFARD